MENPLFSIVIPTYNRANLLNFTLLSLVNQTINKSLFEVIIVDDGSTDNTKEIVSNFKEEMRINYYYQEDIGYRVASARNLGVTKSNGEFILFIDSGIILDPDCVKQHLVSHRNSDKELVVVGYVFGIEEEYDHNETLLKKIDFHNPKDTINKFINANEYTDIREVVYESCNDDIMQLQAPWAVFWTGNLSLRKTAIEEVSGFDIGFDQCWGVEDIDLGYRISQNNITMILNRQAASIHCPHYSNTNEKLKQEYVNKLYFHEKHNTIESKVFLTCTGINLNNQLRLRKSN